jgi:hypothetical protein
MVAVFGDGNAVFIAAPPTRNRAPSRANFLCKTLPKVAAEMARRALTYNLTRVLNIVGVEPLVRYLRNDLKAARTSSENSFGSSQAAKCPPRSTSLK